ncbi:MgtC/SapB family protein [Labrys neptuniae]
MLSNTEIFIRLLLAAGLGSMVGIERERLLWAAGLRTHMLVSVGACLAMIVSAYGFGDVLESSPVVAGRAVIVLDPSRVAAQVISGIGFLGAGTILLRGEVIRGLTTAASLWGVAAIGLAVGGGLYVAALAATAIALVILAGIKPLEERFRSRMAEHTIKLTTDHGSTDFKGISEAVGLGASHIRQYVLEQARDRDRDEITISVVPVSARTAEEIVGRLRQLPQVRNITLIR